MNAINYWQFGIMTKPMSKFSSRGDEIPPTCVVAKPQSAWKSVTATAISGLWLASRYVARRSACSAAARSRSGCAWIDSAFATDSTCEGEWRTERRHRRTRTLVVGGGARVTARRRRAGGGARACGRARWWAGARGRRRGGAQAGGGGAQGGRGVGRGFGAGGFLGQHSGL